VTGKAKKVKSTATTISKVYFWQQALPGETLET